jgi:hypothetical protein
MKKKRDAMETEAAAIATLPPLLLSLSYYE